MSMPKTDKQALRAELSNHAIGSNAHLRKLALALLDELEAAERQHGYLREQRDEWERKAISNFEDCSEMAARIEELESQRKLAFTACNRWKDKFADAEKRIAELEASHAQVIHARDHYKRVASEGIQSLAETRASTVKLPKPHAHLIWIQAGHPPDDFWDDVTVSHSDKDRCCDGSERYAVYAQWEIEEMLAAAGIALDTGE